MSNNNRKDIRRKKKHMADVIIRQVAKRYHTTSLEVEAEITKIILAAQNKPFHSRRNSEIYLLTSRLGRLPTAREVILSLINIEKKL